MEDTRTTLIHKLIQEGKSRHEVRTALISEGFGSKDLDADYERALQELGVEEPKHVHTDFSYTPTEKASLQKSEARHHRKKMGTLKSALVALFVIAFSILLLMFLRGAPLYKEDAGELDLGESLVRTKVETTAASVKVYGGRLGTYEGACDDISVVDPVICKEEGTAFVVFAPLSTGVVYCVDSTGEKGDVIRPLGVRCK